MIQVSSAERILVQLIRSAFPFGTEANSRPRVSEAEWFHAAQAAEENALAPLLYASIKQANIEEKVPADVLQNLRTAYLRSNVANWLAFQELDGLLAVFEREELPAVLLKGCALARTLYPDAALRPMVDIDLLVTRASLDRLGVLLGQQGYSSPIEMRRGFGQRFTNCQTFSRGGNRPIHLEAHWHLFKSPYYCQRVPVEWFWDRTMQVQADGRMVCVFNLQAQLLHLCTHFALHHRAERMIWSYDLALLLARHGKAIDWDDVVQATQEFGLSQSIQAALARVSQVWQVSAPRQVMERLAVLRPPLKDRIAFAMLTAQRGEARIALDGLSAPGVRGKLAFWLDHILPAPEYVRERYRVRHARFVPLYYLWRLGDGCIKFARSLTSSITQR